MEKQKIFEWIVKALSEDFDIEAERVKLESRLYEDLDIDSIDAVDLMVRLKQLTGTRITPVVIRVTEPMLCKGWPWYKVPQRRPHFVLDVEDDIAVPELVPMRDAPAREVRALTTALHGYFTEKIT